LNPETHLARHGVNHSHFAKALLPATAVAAELKDIQGPVLGVIGFIDERVDLQLLENLARANAQWTVVVVGRTHVDVTALQKIPNIKFVGRVPYSRLPEFCKGFTVGLIPFQVNEYTRHVNPIKLREYLSAGLPVVSTKLPEVEVYGQLCTVAATHDEFIEGVKRALQDNSQRTKQSRSDAMRQETWEQKVTELCTHVIRVKQAKRSSV
jgi:glycosyltransferase involved in cell wall biosynthesis